ncbi:MAG: M20/M25/M40 family metallo-hydrolase [Gammaproteobacteria bacterium]
MSFLILIFFFYRIVVISGQHTQPTVDEQYGDLGALKDRLYQHVWELSEEIGERHHEQADALNKAAEYIKKEFSHINLDVKLQSFGEQPYQNLIAEVSGSEESSEIIIIGAHYDTVWLSPGADDNASGIAALLEFAHALSGSHPKKTIRFVAFANEEHPFSGTDEMGSRVYARTVLEKNENIAGMFSLEMLGFFSDIPGSQQYPAYIRWFYPDTASFIAFTSNLSSRSLLVRAIKHYNGNSSVPVQGLVVPAFLVPDIRRSDHASFWELGYPAVMITDTANFRNMNYHSVGDVIGTLNFESMARVVSGLTKMIALLAATD